jgi:hypothetical protein
MLMSAPRWRARAVAHTLPCAARLSLRFNRHRCGVEGPVAADGFDVGFNIDTLGRLWTRSRARRLGVKRTPDGLHLRGGMEKWQ